MTATARVGARAAQVALVLATGAAGGLIAARLPAPSAAAAEPVPVIRPVPAVEAQPQQPAPPPHLTARSS